MTLDILSSVVAVWLLAALVLISEPKKTKEYKTGKILFKKNRTIITSGIWQFFQVSLITLSFSGLVVSGVINSPEWHDLEKTSLVVSLLGIIIVLLGICFYLMSEQQKKSSFKEYLIKVDGSNKKISATRIYQSGFSMDETWEKGDKLRLEYITNIYLWGLIKTKPELIDVEKL